MHPHDAVAMALREQIRHDPRPSLTYDLEHHTLAMHDVPVEAVMRAVRAAEPPLLPAPWSPATSPTAAALGLTDAPSRP